MLEAEALPTSPLVRVAASVNHVFKGVAIGAILRDDVVVAARGDTIIEAGDGVVLFAAPGKASRAESILSD